MFGVALVLMLLTAVVSFFGILLLFLSCSPKGIVRNITLGSLGLVFTELPHIYLRSLILLSPIFCFELFGETSIRHIRAYGGVFGCYCN